MLITNNPSDLPYIYSTEGKIKEPNLAAEAGQGLLSAVGAYARGDMVRNPFLTCKEAVPDQALNVERSDRFSDRFTQERVGFHEESRRESQAHENQSCGCGTSLVFTFLSQTIDLAVRSLGVDVKIRRPAPMRSKLARRLEL